MAMNKKGISPLIATVLVIGFTIVLAGMIIAWGGDLFKGMQETQGKTADIQLACAQASNLVDVSATTTTGLTIDNKADSTIVGFRVRKNGATYTTALGGITPDSNGIYTPTTPTIGIKSFEVKMLAASPAFVRGDIIEVFIQLNVKNVPAFCNSPLSATVAV